MASKKQPPAVGSVPKGKGGSNRTLDGPGVGKAVAADNTRGQNHTAPAGGKAHQSSGGGERKGSYPNAPSDFPSLNGKLNKTADKW